MSKVVLLIFLFLFSIYGYSANFFIHEQNMLPWLKDYIPYKHGFIPLPPVTLAENLAYAESHLKQPYEQEQCMEPDSNLQYFYPSYSKPHLRQWHDKLGPMQMGTHLLYDGQRYTKTDSDKELKVANEQPYGVLSETPERIDAESLKRPRAAQSYDEKAKPAKLAKTKESPYVQQGTRKRISKETKDILNAWLYAHLDNPYPNNQEKEQLVKQTGLDYQQLNNWFTNVRRRNLDISRTGPRSTIN